MPLTQSPASLAYPAGIAPSFDPLHPLSAGISPSSGFSAVASGGGFYSVSSGTQWAITGSPSFGIDSRIGPNSNLDVIGKQFQISNQRAFTPVGVTFAIIIIGNTFAGNQAYLFDATNYSFGAFSGNFILFAGTTKTFSGFAPAAGVPYLYMASINASALNFVVANLSTGQINYGTTTGVLPATGSVWRLSNTASNPANAKISHAAVSYMFMSIPQIIQIADDPWSFWYPQYDFLSPATDLGGPGTPWWDSGTSMDSGLGAQNRSGRRLIIPGPSGNIPPFSPPPPPPPPPGGTAIFTVSGFSVQDRFPDATVNSSYAPMQRPTDTN